MPPPVRAAARWALVIVEDGRPVRAIVAGQGAVATPTTADPRALARKLDVAAVIVLETDVLARVSAEVERQLRLDQDLVEQGLIVLRALKRHAGKGIWSEPHLLELLPAPSYDAIQRTFDLLVPDGSALLAYVIDDDRTRLHASIIATKQDGDIAAAATHLAIADILPEAALARDWTKQYKRVLAAVEERFARPSLGIFLERDTLERVITGPGDQLARELNARRVILEPAPAWLLGLLGGATVAAFASRGARALASMLPASARKGAADLAARAQTAMRDSGAHPFAMLGFDPIELWQSVRHFYARPTTPSRVK